MKSLCWKGWFVLRSVAYDVAVIAVAGFIGAHGSFEPHPVSK